MRDSVRLAVLERDDYTCRYCAIRPNPLRVWHPWLRRWIGLIHVDHIYPKICGGTDDMSNLATACRNCNLEKANKFWIPLNWDT